MKIENKKLNKGLVNIYDFGEIKLHAYQTNDLMQDESYVLENKSNILLLEFPAFYDNLPEYEEYVKGLNKNIIGKVFSDHPNGGTILKDVKGYASEGTIQSMKQGTIYHLVTGFETSFGGTFAREYHEITEVLSNPSVNLGGFELIITYHEENIEIEFPQINCIYTHMLGHDCHSIVAGEDHANSLITTLTGYLEKGYTLILSSHHSPETLADVQIKINYLEELKQIARCSVNAKEFEEKMKNKFPDNEGLNYLTMTSGFFFPES